MKDVHVVFGTGAIGLALIDELAGRGVPVRAVNRSGSAGVPEGVELLGCDVSDKGRMMLTGRRAQHRRARTTCVKVARSTLLPSSAPAIPGDSCLDVPPIPTCRHALQQLSWPTGSRHTPSGVGPSFQAQPEARRDPGPRVTTPSSGSCRRVPPRRPVRGSSYRPWPPP